MSDAGDEPIARVARGRKPRYFADPATDRLLGMVLTLAEELSVTRDRVDSLERLLAAHDLLPAGAVDGYAPDDDAAGERAVRRQAFIDRVLRVVAADVDDMTAEGVPESVAETLEAFRREDI